MGSYDYEMPRILEAVKKIEKYAEICKAGTEAVDSRLFDVCRVGDSMTLLLMDILKEQQKQTALLSAIAEKLGVEQEDPTSTNESAFK
ncbi:MAG: hypothetical protein IKE01_01125 [Clostridia bacterium]|nr:hypothetical protein [Clostridia bacterium]